MWMVEYDDKGAWCWNSDPQVPNDDSYEPRGLHARLTMGAAITLADVLNARDGFVVDDAHEPREDFKLA